MILDNSFLLTEMFKLFSFPPYRIAGIKPLARKLLFEPVVNFYLFVAFNSLIILLEKVYNSRFISKQVLIK